MKKSLIVGMGFGQAVYKPVLTNLGYQVITVDADPNKGADFTDVTEAVSVHRQFNIVNICTPNFTHDKIARLVASCSDIVFVEKPGVVDNIAWQKLVNDFPSTCIAMVKNNQHRDEISAFRDLASNASKVTIKWNSKNRIPNPGSWFTTKIKAFGGVSRDLIPHMLSYYCALTNYADGDKLFSLAEQRHNLKDVTSTDYGTVNHDGIYNVDDFCEFEFKNGNTSWILTANWKDDVADDSSITFETKSSSIRHELGLCPESAYKKMIVSAVTNLNNDEYWKDQCRQDVWIHKQIELL